MTPNINIIDLAEKHGQTSYRNRADTKHSAYGFTEEGLQAFAHALMAAAPQAVQATVSVVNEDLQDLVSKAMRRSWQLGQTYWQQADSEYFSQQKKSDDTQAKFNALIEETRAALAAQAKQGGV